MSETAIAGNSGEQDADRRVASDDSTAAQDPMAGTLDADNSSENAQEAERAGEVERSDELGSAPSDATAGEDGAESEESARSRTKRLEEEGEVAADYLEELLDILELDGDIDMDVEQGRASVSIGDSSAARSLRRLVGSEGQVLDALQELTRLAVQTKTGERTRLMLDVAGFRRGRRRELESLAAEKVERVRTDGEPVALDPMTPFERKVVHDVVADAGLRSESEGEGDQRHVVIHPASA